MYAYASREEWLFRGLAIATILALVGMAVMPSVAIGDIGYSIGKRMGWDTTECQLWGAAICGIALGIACGLIGGWSGAAVGLAAGALLGAA